jgi:hypothetical protein
MSERSISRVMQGVTLRGTYSVQGSTVTLPVTKGHLVHPPFRRLSSDLVHAHLARAAAPPSPQMGGMIINRW